MIIWPFDSKRDGLPNTVRDEGAWVGELPSLILVPKPHCVFKEGVEPDELIQTRTVEEQ